MNSLNGSAYTWGTDITYDRYIFVDQNIVNVSLFMSMGRVMLSFYGVISMKMRTKDRLYYNQTPFLVIGLDTPTSAVINIVINDG